MKVKNHKEFAAFDYNQFEGEMQYNLGDIVTKISPDETEIGVVIQIHDENELRVDMFGNASLSEITLSTKEEITKHRPKLLLSLNDEILVICAKCSDMCSTQLRGKDGNVIAENDNYVPNNLNIGGGDYVELEINIKSGQILNWKSLNVINVIKEIKKA